ncbi:MAG: hypothetical protein V2A53_05990 [bacterium]
MNIQLLANLSAIIGVPIAIIGSLIAYFTLRHQIRQAEKEVSTLNEIVSLQSKYQSREVHYNNCNFYGASVDANQISQEYQEGIEKVGGK